MQVDEFLAVEDYYRHLLITTNGISISRQGELMIMADYNERNKALSEV
jgi:hypothetical protein